MTPRDVSVVIPTLNEAMTVVDSIRSARAAGAGEVIVVDGGSNDDTIKRAQSEGVEKIVKAFPGRGTQLAGGVAVARGDVVLFLHADNCLDPACLQQICDAEDWIWGAFEHRINSEQFLFRIIERGNAARVRYRWMAFGDQAMFVRRDILQRHGGVAEIPLLEDVDLSKRLSKLGKPKLLPGPLVISPRRWEKRGIVRQTLRNWNFQLRYALGASAESLAKKY